MLLCGLHENDITPPLGASIPGQLADKKSTGVLDGLFAKAAVFDNGTTAFAILSIDICVIMDPHVAAMRESIQALTGIDGRNVLVAATHTHTGGPAELWPRLYPADAGYLDMVVERGVDAVVSAYESRRPAVVGFGLGSEERIAFHRRYRMRDGSVRTNPGICNPDIVEPDGPIDPDVSVIRIDDVEGVPMGVITNFACHLDCVGGTMLSGDYPSAMGRALKAALGDGVVSLFLTGACGNINHIDFMAADPVRHEHWKWMGEVLAGDVLAVRRNTVTEAELPMLIRTGFLQATRREPNLADREFAAKALSQPKEQLSEADWWRAMQIDLISKDSSWHEPVTLEILAVRLGDMAIVALPNEIFVEYALEIKANSGFPYMMVSTLSGGMFGYVPTPSALLAGGYECALAYTSCMQADMGTRIVEMAGVLLDGMSEE